jgi:3-deoxy-D-manno-octulosonic acid kinase
MRIEQDRLGGWKAGRLGGEKVGLLNTMPLKCIESYWIGSDIHLSGGQLWDLIGQFGRPAESESKALSGRCSVACMQIKGIGTAAIKSYRRGGLLQYINKRHYLKVGQTRGQREYGWLQAVRGLGINAPEPVAYAYRGRLIYSAWLVTREIPRALSLAQCSLAADRPLNRALKSTANQLALLIQHGIHHVDLHPGNVLLDENDNAFLLDFDGCRMFAGNPKILRRKYRTRWNRAVRKHRLPSILGEAIPAEP